MNRKYKLSEQTRKRMSEAHKGKSSGMKGKKQSKETIKKRIESRKWYKHSKETKEKISEGNKGKIVSEKSKKKMSKAKRGCIPWNKGKEWPKEIKEKMSKSRIGKKLSEETKEKISKSIRKKFENGTMSLACFISSKFWSKKNKTWVNCRSSYEKKAFNILEKMPMVTKYEVESLKIQYRNGYDDVRTYFPDIFITYKDKSKELIEIKPSILLKNPNNIKKFKAAKRFCKNKDIKFKVWTEYDIFKNNLRNPIKYKEDK